MKPMRKRSVAISMLMLILAFVFVVAGCTNTELTGIEITTPPSKIEYVEGETFDSTGMVVTANYSDGSAEAVTDYTVDKTEPLTVSDTVVTVSYEGFTATVNITVTEKEPDIPALSVTDVIINEDVTYIRTMDASSVIQFKAVYSDGTTDSEWRNASPDDLVGWSVKGEEITLELDLLVGTRIFDKTVTLQIADDNVISVSELREKSVEEAGEYLVEGVVVSIASTTSNIEYILKDVDENVYIGVQGITSTGSMPVGDYVARYEIGDQVCLPVTLARVEPAAGADTNKGVVKSDDNKVYAEYAGGELYETGVVEKDIELNFDKEAVTQIDSQEDLVNFLSAENRAGNAYTMVKLCAPLYSINYTNGNSVFYRFMFEGVTSYAAQKIDGSNTSPVFANFNQLYTTGETVGDILVGDSEWTPTSWGNPGPVARDVYAVFVGGNTYYHYFVILDYETSPGLTAQSFELDGMETSYKEGDTFSTDGGKLTINYGKGAYTSDIMLTVPLELDMLDPDTVPDMTEAGNYTVKGSYGSISFEYAVTVDNDPSSITLAENPSVTSFNYRNWQQDAIAAFVGLNLNVSYDGSSDRQVPVSADMISFEDTDKALTKKVVITYWDATTSLDITVTVPENVTSVTQAKGFGAGETVYDLNGIVISSAFISGTTTNPVNGEIFIKDKNNGNVIGLKDMGISYDNKLAGLQVGDEILVPVTMQVTTTTATASENGKITAYKVDGANYVVLSSGNATTLDFNSAVTVSNQDELIAFLKDAETRCGNMYKLVKFAAGAKYINYNGGLYLTFLEDPNVTSIKIDGNKSPYLHIMNQSMTLGDKTYGDILNDGNAISSSFSEPLILDKDVYLLYAGGQGNYYHQFLLLGEDYVREPSTVSLTGIEVTTLPDKLVYEEGERFDPTGMVVTATYSDNSTAVITGYTIDKTDGLTYSDTTITISYGAFTDTITITVASPVTVSGIVVNEEATWTRTTDIASAIQYKIAYSDGTTDDEWRGISDEELVSWSIENGKLNVEIKVTVGGIEYEKTASLQTTDSQVISVAELKGKEVAEGVEYLVEGVVVTVVSTGSNVEYIIKDVDTDAYIGVIGLTSATTGSITDGTHVPVYEAGDQIRIPVTLAKIAPSPDAATDSSTIKSNDNKIYADYAGGDLYESAVVETGISVAFDKEQAKTITSQAELRDFLSAQNRAGNAYTVVKFSAPVYVIKYNDNFWRLMFEGVTNYTDQKIDGKNTSPVFANFNQMYATGKNLGEELFNNADFAPVTAWGDPTPVAKDVYVLFIGGNSWYHHFVILECEPSAELTLDSYEFSGLKTEYQAGETFSVENATVTLNYGAGEYASDIVLTLPLDGLLDPETIPSDMSQPATYTVKGSYGSAQFEFIINVDNEPTGIALADQTAVSAGYANWEEEALAALTALKLNVTYADAPQRQVPVTAEMITFADGESSNVKKATITYWGQTTTCDITLKLPEDSEYTSVTSAKGLEAGETIYNLNGIVVSSAFISGTATSPANGEIFIKDKANGNVIGLKDMGISYDNKLAGLKVGDEILVAVTMRVTSTSTSISETGKIAAYKVAESAVVVLSSDNSAALDLSSAVEISEQADLEAFLKDAETRRGNVYKLVKLMPGTKLVRYNDTNNSAYIFLDDASGAVETAIDGRQPYLSVMNEQMTLGDKTYSELILGDAEAKFGTFTEPTILDKEVYLMYIGGQGAFYHQFILLGADYVVTPAAAPTV